MGSSRSSAPTSQARRASTFGGSSGDRLSVVLTDWLSVIATLGAASLPSASRTTERSVSLTSFHVPSAVHARKYLYTVCEGGRSLESIRQAHPLRSVYRMPLRGPRGYDAGKKIYGRKRHIIVDTTGLLPDVVVHPADIQDRDGAKLVIAKVKGRSERMRLIWPDAGYAGNRLIQSQDFGNTLLDSSRRECPTGKSRRRPRPSA